MSDEALNLSFLEADILIFLLRSYCWVLHTSRWLFLNLSAQSSVLIYTEKVSNKKRWEVITKIPFGVNDLVHHWKWWTHQFKLSISCNNIHVWYCIQSYKQVKMPQTCSSLRLIFWCNCCDHIFGLFAWVGDYSQTGLSDLVCLYTQKKVRIICNKTIVRGNIQNTFRCIQLVCIIK